MRHDAQRQTTSRIFASAAIRTTLCALGNSCVRPVARHSAAFLLLVLLGLGSTGCQSIICLADPDEEHLCEEPSDVLDERLDAEDPVAWTGGIAYRVPAADRVTLLETSGNSASVVHLPVAEEPALMVATPDRQRLLVVSQKASELAVIDPEARRVVRRFDLGSPFDTLTVSEDGQYAIAWYSGASDTFVRNVNEMAIVRLREDASEDNPQLITLRSFGSRPYDIEFAPPFTVFDGEERRFALVLAENYITLLELDGFEPENPAENETVVRFVSDGDSRVVRPQRILWTDDDPNVPDDVFAFILATGSDDVISLNLVPSGDVDSLGRPRIRPTLNQLTGGRTPVDFGLFDDLRGDRKLITVNSGTQDIAILDVATGDAVTIPLDVPVKSVLLYRAVNPDTDREEPYALLYDPTGVVRTLLFVELASAEVRRGRAVNRLNLERPVESLERTPDGLKALILHPGRDAFSILNLERRAVAPLEVSAPISDYDFVPGAEEWLVTSYQGAPYIALTELSTAHSDAVELDMDATRTIVLPDTDTIVIDHGVALGAVTLVPLSGPTRGRARMYQGFAADQLLEIRE